MARWHRSSDEPVPYGPPPASSGAPGEPSPAPPAEPGPPPPPAPPGLPPPGDGPEPVTPWAPPPGAYSSAVPGGEGLQYGRTLDRVMAYLLDGLIVSVPVFVIVFALGSGVLGGMRQSGITLVAGIVGMGVNLLYFVSFWTGSAQATPGMRLMKLRIGDARTGATPTVGQGLTRWLALGGIFQLVELVPPLLLPSVLCAFVWELILLATTASSPTKQGVHDRIVNTALVQPASAQTPAVTCLVILVALFALWVLGLVLVLLSGDVSRILSEIGASV